MIGKFLEKLIFHIVKFIQRQRVQNFINNRKVLDVGCGNGIITKKLKADKVIGIDINADSIPKISTKKLKFLVGDAHNLPFNNKSFDSIISTSVLEHLKFPEIALKECKRCLKSKGTLVISVPNIERVSKRIEKFLRGRKTFPKSHKKEYTLKELFKLIYLCGFEIKKATSDCIYPCLPLAPLALTQRFIIKAKRP